MSTEDDDERSWRATRRAIAADRARLREHLAAVSGDGRGWLAVRPAFQAVFLYRLSRYLYLRGWRLSARLIWLINVAWTGADLGPTIKVGAGLLIPNPIAIIIAGNAGQNCTFLPQSGIGGLLKGATKDLGAGAGLPVLGDGVQLEVGALVLGAVSIGNNVLVGPRCLVTRDLPDNVEVVPFEWRAVARGAADPNARG